MRTWQIFLGLLFGFLTMNVSAHADDVQLMINDKDRGTQYAFTMADLQIMDKVAFETQTIWTDGIQSFEGVSLKALLAHTGILDGVVSAVAVNDYAVEIPVSELTDNAPIVAYSRNGEPMSIRDKGPLWVVYPYDRSKAFQTELVYSRSIWQLNRLDMK